MIAYVDSSVLARAYLVDEVGHEDVRRLIEDDDVAVVTGTWTVIEVSGALVRADRGSRSGNFSAGDLLKTLDADVSGKGRVTILRVDQERVEEVALGLVRSHGLRAMDAWHLATASLAVPPLAERSEKSGFASRDRAQLAVAESLGFQPL